MKVTITRPIELEADLPKGTVVLKNSPKGWVTWFWKEKGHNSVHVCTCEDTEFDCQNDTMEIELNKDELQELVKLIK